MLGKLTLELVGKGYFILLDGKRWIQQEHYFPYGEGTVEEKGLAHIQAINDEWARPPEATDSERIEFLESVVNDLLFGGM